MKLFIWLLFLLAIYPYIVYPLVLKLISKLKKPSAFSKACTEEFFPKATLLITAYNEEQFLEEKIQNSLELDYPDLEIVVVSDGSIDQTNTILLKYPEIKTLLLPKRQGKPTALKAGLELATGDVIFFSDVSALYSKNSLKMLIKPLLDEKVGATGGILSLKKQNLAILGEVTYSDYETTLRALETQIFGTIVLPGTFYALRRENIVLPPENIIADDFYITCSLLEKGLRLVQVDLAVAFEQASYDTSGEFVRKARIIAGGIQTLALFPRLFCSKWGFFMFSHKLLRWGSALLLVLHYLLLLISGFYPWLLGLESILMLLGIIGIILDITGVKTPRFLALLRHFIVVNAAVIWGIMGLVSGRQTVKWQR
ncbi:MAG: glycosyltransferase [Firmicutes bacterium]|nr:glycosyltransferase [Bacillota bacterium]MDD4263296.1 glycosyltransferase [Bacillota bacterium]MDD4694223.1 glycosyltransferase [Bacillota bacterium]